MMARSWLRASLVGLGVLAGFPAGLTGQVDAPLARTLAGRVIDESTGVPVMGARIELGDDRAATQSNRAGEFSFPDVLGDSVALRAWRLGYESLDTTIVVSSPSVRVTLALQALPIALAPLTGRARASSGGAERERALFDREVTAGVVGVSGAELRDLPAVGEADVLRSLQVIPGVVFLNDLSARLHVRGGGPDQNLFQLDGARIFAPYHMFSMMGAFNADAIARVEMYRGSLPARFGGALSSVIEIEHQDGTIGGRAYDGGLSLLGVRIMARDIVPMANASWMLALRRTHLDVIADKFVGRDFPYAFHDVNARFTVQPRSNQRVRASFFTSSDRFRLFLGGGDDRMASRWRNIAGSVRWELTGSDRWDTSVEAWGSRYAASLVVGASTSALTTVNEVGVAGLRIETTRTGRTASLRGGIDMEAGRLHLVGSERAGGYVDGDTRDTFVLPAAYMEVDTWFGPLRVASGLRATILPDGSPVLAPRIAARLHFNDDLALTAGLARSYQSISTVRDDRYPLPGAPFWFMHPPSNPASRADAVTIGFEGWAGDAWSFTLGAYARQFDDVPRWRPEGARDLSQVVFDAAHAEGVELMLRHHASPVTGWIGYGYGRVRATESGTQKRYSPNWDRRHSLDLGVFGDVTPALRVTGRVAYGSGVPFWPVVGENDGLRFDPLQGTIELGDNYPVWSTQQMRLPAYARVDLALRYRFDWLGAEFEPHLDLLNVLSRPNVLYYELRTDGNRPPTGNEPVEPRLHPVTMPALALPGIGIRVRF